MKAELTPATQEGEVAVADITKMMQGTKLENGKSLWSTTVETLSMADGKNTKNDVICKTLEESIATLANMVKAIEASDKKWLFPVTPFTELNKTADDLMRAFCMWSKKDGEDSYNVSKAFRRLESYANWMDQNSFDLQSPLSTESVKETHKAMNVKLTHVKGGGMAWWIDMGAVNVDKVKKGSHASILRSFVWIAHVVMFDMQAQKNGLVFVQVMGTKLSLWTMMTMIPPELSAKIDRLSIGVMPVKTKKIYIIEAPSWMRLFMILLKPFLSKKMRQRLVFVSKKDGVAQATLDDEIGREGIPRMFSEFEGSAAKEIVSDLLDFKE